MEVCGHQLPGLLVELLEQGRWRTPDGDRLLALLPPCADRVYKPMLYDVAAMERETRFNVHGELLEGGRWERCPDRAREFLRAGLAGRHAVDATPGRIDPDRVLLIGDGGMDMPIALHYAPGPGEPAIIHQRGDGAWIVIAVSLPEFAAALSL